MKKIFILIIPVFVILLIFYLVDLEINSFVDSIHTSLEIVQIFAIIFGGLWAYRKFGWEKKCENIISLKSALDEFVMHHSMNAMLYRKDSNIVKYKLAVMPAYNEFQKKIGLSYYLPKKLRKRLFEAIWLTIGNDHGEKLEKLDDNWKKFEEEVKEINEEFEKIISL